MKSHVLRLMLLRHDLSGLAPQSLVTVAVVLSVSALCALVRWNLSVAVGHLFILYLMTAIMSPRLGMAYALLSAGIDVVGFCLEPIAGDAVNGPLGIWEFVGLVWIIIADCRKPAPS